MGKRQDDREMLFVVGTTAEEKFASIEIALQRMRRRLAKTVVVVMPPTIMQGYCITPEEDGTIFRGFFPVKGKLKAGGFYIGKYNITEPITIYCDLISPDSRGGTKFTTLKRQMVENFNLDVPECSRVRIRVDDPASISDIWIGLAIVVEQSYAETQQFLIKELDQLIEAAHEGI